MINEPHRSLTDLLEMTGKMLKERVDGQAQPIGHVIGPYRICPLGAHVDHQGGDVLGRTVNAYYDSSIQLHEAGNPAIIQLMQIVVSSPGMYGSRFSGGGYGGWVVALVDTEALPEVKEQIDRRYLAAFPEATGRAYSFTAEVEGGLRIV